MRTLPTNVVLFVVLLMAAGAVAHESAAAESPYRRLDSLILLHERAVAEKCLRIDSLRATAGHHTVATKVVR